MEFIYYRNFCWPFFPISRYVSTDNWAVKATAGCSDD